MAELTIRAQIDALVLEIAVEVEEIERLREEYKVLLAGYPPPSYVERYGRITKLSELAKELRSKRGRLGWLRKWYIPELAPGIELFQYATRGDSKNPYPYKWVIVFDFIDSDYEHLKAALKETPKKAPKEKTYWERYWRTRRLKILRVQDGYRYAFEEEKGRPVIYILAGDVHVTRKDYTKKPHVCEHQAAFTVSILKTLGLVEGYHRERKRMTETELEFIPVRVGP